MLSDKQIKSAFFQLESDPELFRFTVAETSLYFILRFNLEMVYRCMSNELEQNVFEKWKISIKRNILSSLFSSKKNKVPFSDNLVKHEENILPSKFLFVSTSDWTIAKGESIELIDIIHYYRSKSVTINFVQPDFGYISIKKQSYYDGFYTLETNNYNSLSGNDINVIRKFLLFVSNRFNINLQNEIESYSSYVAYILSMSFQLGNLIQASRAEYVFARSVYTEPWIMMACKKAGAKCIEVQHGVITPDNIYYQSAAKANETLTHFLWPDYQLMLGEQWTKILIDQKCSFNSGNTFTLGTKNIAEINITHRKKFNILICLQHGIFSINDILVPFIKKNERIFKNENIHLIIRPHPNSIGSTKKLYSNRNGNCITVVDSRKISFLDQLAVADLLLSASSMCLYEALALGIPVASFTKFKTVTIEEEMQYIDSAKDLIAVVSKIRNGEYKQKSLPYLSPFNSSVLDKFLNE